MGTKVSAGTGRLNHRTSTIEDDSDKTSLRNATSTTMEENEYNEDYIDDEDLLHIEDPSLIEPVQDHEINGRSKEVNCSDSGEYGTVMDVNKLMKLHIQFYDNEEREEPTLDDIKCVKRYVKQIYRNVKFPSDNTYDFNKPCFVYQIVDPMGTKKDWPQTITIANMLMSEKESGRKFSLKSKIYWWKGYREVVRKEFNRLRQAEIRAFQSRFVDGMLIQMN